MDAHAIPGISEELSSEFEQLDRDFSAEYQPSDNLDTEEHSHLFFPREVDLDASVVDSEEKVASDAFFSEENLCCKLGPKQSACWKQFSHDTIVRARQESMDPEKSELDMSIMATLHAVCENDSEGLSSRTPIKYQFGGKRIIYRVTFMFIYTLSKKHLENLIKYYNDEGLCTRIQKNKKKRPHNQTDHKNVQKIKGFIEKFADNHAMPLPGRLPDFKDYCVMLLPSDMTKSAVYRLYVKACDSRTILSCV